MVATVEKDMIAMAAGDGESIEMVKSLRQESGRCRCLRLDVRAIELWGGAATCSLACLCPCRQVVLLGSDRSPGCSGSTEGIPIEVKFGQCYASFVVMIPRYGNLTAHLPRHDYNHKGSRYRDIIHNGQILHVPLSASTFLNINVLKVKIPPNTTGAVYA